MQKQIFTTILCGFLALNLTACSIPFFGEKTDSPPIEQKRSPDQIFSLMLDKMRNDLKTADYNAKINVVADIDQEKLSSETKSKINDSVLSLGVDRPHVLGIDNSEELEDLKTGGEEKKIAIISEADYGIAPSLSPSSSIFNFGKNKLKVKVDYDVKGKIDRSDKDNLKGESNLNMEVDVSGMIIRFSFESKVIGDNIYFKVDQLPPPFSMMVDSELLEKWWNINLTELNEEQKKDDGIFNGGMPSDLSVYFDEEKTKEFQKELEEMIIKHQIFKVAEVLPEETIDEKLCYHYRVELDKNIIRSAFLEIFDFLENEIDEGIDEMVKSSSDDKILEIKTRNNLIDDEARKEMKEILGQFINIISEYEIDVWIDRDEYFLRKTKFDFVLNLKELEIDGLAEDVKDAIEIDIVGEINYSNINKEVSIEAPIEYESFLSYVGGMLGSAQMKSRDAKRLSDVKQIQTALELYYNDNSQYADNLDNLVEQGYFRTIPENPKNNDGVCPKDFEYSYKTEIGNQDYELNYCLGLSMGGVVKGENTECASGIQGCKPKVQAGEQNKNTDSDLDGLFDWEEIEIYKTNPNNSDTDNDGYLDGDEVKKGYNPNGAGKLLTTKEDDAWKEYIDEDFTIKYSDNWIADEQISQISEEEKALSGIKLQLLSQYDDDNDNFRENVLVSIIDISTSPLKTVDDWNANYIANPEYSVISSEKVSVGGSVGIDLKYFMNIQKDNIEQKIKFHERYFIREGKRYSVLFSGAIVSEGVVDYEKEALQIMDSFKLK